MPPTNLLLLAAVIAVRKREQPDLDMKKIHAFGLMFAPLLVMAENYDLPENRIRETKRRMIEPRTPIAPAIPKGCKRFIIDGIEVIAINEKNAIKKAAKLRK